MLEEYQALNSYKANLQTQIPWRVVLKVVKGNCTEEGFGKERGISRRGGAIQSN